MDKNATEQRNAWNLPLPSSPNSINVARVVETRNGRECNWSVPFEARHGYRWAKEKAEEVKKRNIRFFCPLKDSHTGFCCPAELVPCKSGTSFHYETKKGSYHHHVFATKKRTVSDIVSQDVSSFLSSILEPRKRKEHIANLEITVYKDRFDVPQQEPEIVPPDNILDYYLQTRGCILTDYMPDSKFRFCDCLMNRDTVNEFRSGFSQFGMPVIVIAEPVADPVLSDSIKRNFEQNENTAVLRDPFHIGPEASDMDRLYFIVQCETGGIAEKFKRGNRYLILCEWDLSRILEVDSKNNEARKIRIAKGTILKSSVQIRVLEDKYFQISEEWPKHSFI